MKKILITISIIITSLFFVGNVSAETTTPIVSIDNFVAYSFDKYEPSSNLSEYKNAMNRMIEAMNVDLETEDFFITTPYFIGNYELYGYKWKKNSEFIFPFGVYCYYANSNNRDLTCETMGKFTSNSSFEYYKWRYYDGVSKINHISYNENNKFPYFNNFLERKLTKSYPMYFYSSVDIKFYNMYDFISAEKLKSDYNYTRNFIPKIIIEDLDNKVSFECSNNTILYKNNGDKSLFEVKPSIDFKNLQKNVLAEQVIGMNVDIFMNHIDNDKHLVQYSSKINNDYYISQGYVEQWTDIEDTSQPFNYSTSINDTLYVRVIDKEKYYDSVDKGEDPVIDLITSNALTFTGINEITPYITYNVITPKECKISGLELGQVFSRSACQKLTADIHNMNFNKYSLYYIESDSKLEYIDITDTTDRSSWKGLYATTFDSTYSNEKYVAIIVFDKLRDKVAEVKIMHLDVVDIATAGFQIHFSESFNDYLKYVNLKLTIYNDNNYKYYYSIDNGFKYIELTDINLVDERMTIKETNIKIYQNGKVLIKVVDTDNNVIGIYEHDINYKELGVYTEKSFGNFIHDIFNFFITPISYIFSLIASFFNTLPQILQYMFGGIFILALVYYILKFLI